MSHKTLVLNPKKKEKGPAVPMRTKRRIAKAVKEKTGITFNEGTIHEPIWESDSLGTFSLIDPAVSKVLESLKILLAWKHGSYALTWGSMSWWLEDTVLGFYAKLIFEDKQAILLLETEPIGSNCYHENAARLACILAEAGFPINDRLMMLVEENGRLEFSLKELGM